MKCEICNTHEQKYNYKLNDQSSVLVCELCGKVLYEFNIETKDRLTELCAMVNYTEFVKKLELRR